jgi:hypothetical protein
VKTCFYDKHVETKLDQNVGLIVIIRMMELIIYACITKVITPWSRVILEKLIVAHLFKKLRLLWNPNVYYRVHKSPPLIHILNKVDLVHTSHPTYLRLILISFFSLHLGLPCGPIPLGFRTRNLNDVTVHLV